MELTMKSARLDRRSLRSASNVRLTLQPNEALRLSPLPRSLRVTAGTAWITWRGTDVVLQPGESIDFTAGGERPVLSPTGRGGVTVELAA